MLQFIAVYGLSIVMGFVSDYALEAREKGKPPCGLNCYRAMLALSLCAIALGIYSRTGWQDPIGEYISAHRVYSKVYLGYAVIYFVAPYFLITSGAVWVAVSVRGLIRGRAGKPVK